MLPYLLTAAAALAGYLTGSVNLSIIFSRLRGRDIRTEGSGNAGATNTLRTMGKGLAATVFLFDILKGFLPAFILTRAFFTQQAYVYAVFAVVGHCFPLYFGFRGGKGVSTAIGALFAIAPQAACMILIEFIVILLLFRYVSLASITAAFNAPFFALYFSHDSLMILSVAVIVLIVIFKHRSNIIRIREGAEKPIFGKRKP